MGHKLHSANDLPSTQATREILNVQQVFEVDHTDYHKAY